MTLAGSATHLQIRLSLTPHPSLSQVAELQHLIASQPTSIEAVRLQTFVQPDLQLLQLPEVLNKHEVHTAYIQAG